MWEENQGCLLQILQKEVLSPGARKIEKQHLILVILESAFALTCELCAMKDVSQVGHSLACLCSSLETVGGEIRSRNDVPDRVGSESVRGLNVVEPA